MKLSRKWLNEFVELSLEEKNDRDFAEAMTMSGSKVEGTSLHGRGHQPRRGRQDSRDGALTTTPTTCGPARSTSAASACCR